MTPEQVQAINLKENGRVGRVVQDLHGRSYWITDTYADRWRVQADDGSVYWFDTKSRTAAPIKEPKRKKRG